MPGEIIISKSIVKAQEVADAKEVAEAFAMAAKKLAADLNQGFFTAPDADDTGIAGVYNNTKDANFIAYRTIINGQIISTSLYGTYVFHGQELLITADQSTGDQEVTCRVFLNHSLVADRTSGNDVYQQAAMAGHASDKFANGEFGKFKAASRNGGNAYRFALGMLEDYLISTVDENETARMRHKMNGKDYPQR